MSKQVKRGNMLKTKEGEDIAWLLEFKPKTS